MSAPDPEGLLLAVLAREQQLLAGLREALGAGPETPASELLAVVRLQVATLTRAADALERLEHQYRQHRGPYGDPVFTPIWRAVEYTRINARSALRREP